MTNDKKATRRRPMTNDKKVLAMDASQSAALAAVDGAVGLLKADNATIIHPMIDAALTAWGASVPQSAHLAVQEALRDAKHLPPLDTNVGVILVPAAIVPIAPQLGAKQSVCKHRGIECAACRASGGHQDMPKGRSINADASREAYAQLAPILPDGVAILIGTGHLGLIGLSDPDAPSAAERGSSTDLSPYVGQVICSPRGQGSTPIHALVEVRGGFCGLKLIGTPFRAGEWYQNPSKAWRAAVTPDADFRPRQSGGTATSVNGALKFGLPSASDPARSPLMACSHPEAVAARTAPPAVRTDDTTEADENPPARSAD